MTQSDVFTFSSYGRSHPGHARAVNQDAYLALPQFGVFAVADGVGGHQRGDTASKAVVDAIAALLRSELPEDLAEAVRTQILGVNLRLLELARELGPDTIIGSTVAALVAEERHCVCLWAGDSRIYGMRHGRLKRLTRDHSQVEQLVDQGYLTAEEALRHPHANVIYRAVGMSEDLEIDAVVYDVYVNDKFLLCTDGLTKEVKDEEISDVLTTGTCRENCRDLVELALSRGCRDNIAVVVVDVEPEADRQGDDERTIPLPVDKTCRAKSG